MSTTLLARLRAAAFRHHRAMQACRRYERSIGAYRGARDYDSRIYHDVVWCLRNGF